MNLPKVSKSSTVWLLGSEAMKTTKSRPTDKLLPVMDIFGPTVQGEGKIAGQVSYFLRMGLCSYRCSWCDQMESVDPILVSKNAKWRTQEQIFEELKEFTKHSMRGTWLTISGGDPLSHDLQFLVMSLQAEEWLRIAVETQGSIYQDWLRGCDLITVSPKPPSSGMSGKTDFGVLESYVKNLDGRIIFKVVIFSEGDADFAEQIAARFRHTPLYLSAGTPTQEAVPKEHRHPEMKSLLWIQAQVLKSYSNLGKIVLGRPYLHNATLLPQLHVLMSVK